VKIALPSRVKSVSGGPGGDSANHSATALSRSEEAFRPSSNQQKEIKALTASLKEQALHIEKVGDQLEQTSTENSP
jgi:hypothetical protein